METASILNINVCSQFVDRSQIDCLLKHINSADNNFSKTTSPFNEDEKYGLYNVFFLQEKYKLEKEIVLNFYRKANKYIQYIYGEKVWTDENLSIRIWNKGSYQEVHADAEYNSRLSVICR